MATGTNFKKVWNLDGAQVALLHNRPKKDANKFMTVRKTADGHNWIRIHKILLTDCNCFDLETGEPTNGS